MDRKGKVVIAGGIGLVNAMNAKIKAQMQGRGKVWVMIEEPG